MDGDHEPHERWYARTTEFLAVLAEVYLMWGEPAAAVAEQVGKVRAAFGRELRFGMRGPAWCRSGRATRRRW